MKYTPSSTKTPSMQIYREITPLQESDVFVVLDSMSNGFDYPIHNHPEYELNLVAGMSGTRIVGDSTERYTDYDLVLLGPYLYHKWDGDAHLQATGTPYRVITIQFAMELFDSQLFQKDRFIAIKRMLRESTRGIRFHGETFEKAMRLMMALTEERGFDGVISFFQLLDILSISEEKHLLSSEGFTARSPRSESYRIQVAYGYILKRFADPNLRMADVAAQVGMSISAFSHFFRKGAFRSFSDFLIDVRVGHACKLLLDTDQTVSQVGFRSGFNNLANFNRQFRKWRGCTPLEYRRRHLRRDDFDWIHQVTPWQFIPQRNKQLQENIRPQAYATRLVHH